MKSDESMLIEADAGPLQLSSFHTGAKFRVLIIQRGLLATSSLLLRAWTQKAFRERVTLSLVVERLNTLAQQPAGGRLESQDFPKSISTNNKKGFKKRNCKRFGAPKML